MQKRKDNSMNDEEWNAAITAGDKLTRFGSMYGPKSFKDDFSSTERKVILRYIDKKD